MRQLEFVHAVPTAIDPGMAARAADTAARMQRDEFWPGARQGLTQRESEILSYVVNGLSNRGIASKLVIGDETVKSRLPGRSTASSASATGPVPSRPRWEEHLPVSPVGGSRSPPTPFAISSTPTELALLRELIQAASSGPGSNRSPPRRPG